MAKGIHQLSHEEGHPYPNTLDPLNPTGVWCTLNNRSPIATPSSNTKVDHQKNTMGTLLSGCHVCWIHSNHLFMTTLTCPTLISGRIFTDAIAGLSVTCKLRRGSIYTEEAVWECSVYHKQTHGFTTRCTSSKFQ